MFIVNEPGAGGDAHTAAVRLYTAIVGREGRPNTYIADLQRRMNIPGDGIVGRNTRARLSELLIVRGNRWGSTEQRRAALEYSVARHMGVTDRSVITALQQRMGGSIVADGLPGLLSDMRATQLLESSDR